MTLDELIKAVGLDNDESKEKQEILKKEFNALTKANNTLTKKVETLEKEAEEVKPNIEKLDIITKAFNLDLESEDFDKMLDDKKDEMIKAAGGGTTPEEVKILNRDLTKAQRDLAASKKQVDELSEKLNQEVTHRINSVKRDTIQKALLQHNIIKPEHFIDTFMNKAEVDKDGTTVTIKGDGGNELSVSDAIADWAKANPEFVKKDITGGLGSGGTGQAGNKNKNGISDFMQSILEETAPSSNGGEKSLAELFG